MESVKATLAPHTKPIWFRDYLFLTALCVAVPVWAGLYLFGVDIRHPGWVVHSPLLFLQLALIYPMLEEIVFRGAVQGSLWKTPMGRELGLSISLPNVLTSLIFMVFHFYSHSWLWALAVIFPSLIFGLCRDRYGHVMPAIVLHVFYNAGYFLLFGA